MAQNLRIARSLVAATRTQPELAWGAGPRAAISLLRCSRALATIRDRRYVIPDDVQQLAPSVIAHRVRLAPEAQVAGLTLDAVLERVTRSVVVPAQRSAPPA
jgi:MoxR-like ATPase